MPFLQIPAGVKIHITGGKIICKEPLGLPKLTDKPPSRAKKVLPYTSASLRTGLRMLADGNERRHLVFALRSYPDLARTRICFVDARGQHAMVDSARLLPPPDNVDLSTVHPWWGKCVIPVDPNDPGAAYFPLPPHGFVEGEYVTVCIPDIEPLDALVDDAYSRTKRSTGGKYYKVIYSEDSPYDSGIVDAKEVMGPRITFDPSKDFRHPGSTEVFEPISPGPTSELLMWDAEDDSASLLCNEDMTLGMIRTPSEPFIGNHGALVIGDVARADSAFSTPKKQYVLFSDRRALRP